MFWHLSAPTQSKLRAVKKCCSWDAATAGTTGTCCGSGCELLPGRCLLLEGPLPSPLVPLHRTPAASFSEMCLQSPLAKLPCWIAFLESCSLILTHFSCLFSFLQLEI